jgi:DeoR/GlpR family transcriptional regulator of sugar metabolism
MRSPSDGDPEPGSIIGSLAQALRDRTCGEAFVASDAVNSTGKRAIADYIAHNMAREPRLLLDAGSTSLLIAESIVKQARSVDGLHIVTNNLAVTMYLLANGIPSSLLGGPVDANHLCTLPADATAVIEAFQGRSYQAIVTAAAIRLAPQAILIRARRPDQFEFKCHVLGTASTRVIAVDHTKWTTRFDGEHEFPIPAVPGMHVVVDADSASASGEPGPVRALCERLGHHLHVALR